ncbi:MAG: hypothetical protein AAF078_04535, partial [Planctomycetota bacterium]
HLERGDVETAIKRFNQAWSMHPDNASALWGMAIVQTLRAQSLEPTDDQTLTRMNSAVELIAEAIALPEPDASMLTDAAWIVATRGGLRRFRRVGLEGQDFAAAEDLLQQAEAWEKHPRIYEIWAALERYRGDEEKAKEWELKAEELAKDLGYTNAPPQDEP